MENIVTQIREEGTDEVLFRISTIDLNKIHSSSHYYESIIFEGDTTRIALYEERHFTAWDAYKRHHHIIRDIRGILNGNIKLRDVPYLSDVFREDITRDIRGILNGNIKLRDVPYLSDVFREVGFQ